MEPGPAVTAIELILLLLYVGRQVVLKEKKKYLDTYSTYKTIYAIFVHFYLVGIVHGSALGISIKF
jgi:hypothetical protein